jgi:proteasome accessory factor A
MGVEQEYALAFPREGHPGNRALFLAILAGVTRRVPTRPAGGMWGWARERVFTATGGSLYYESLPRAADAGLVEAATPECRGPSETMRYARAWDRLLHAASREASRRLGADVVLRKNGRDAFDHVYGPQESYEVPLATGWDLVGLRAGLAILAPLAIVAAVVHLVVVAITLIVGVQLAVLAHATGVIVALVQRLSGEEEPTSPTRWVDTTIEALATAERLSLAVWFGPLVLGWSGLLHALAFKPYRRGATAFLVTRMILSGAGSLRQDGTFELSEKASSLRRELRWTFASGDRGLYETGHLLKGLLGPMLLRLDHLAALFRGRQRLQLGLSDANLCEVAEYLKLGTTALVLDLVEAGVLDDVPRPVDPIEAVHRVSQLGIHAPVRLDDGRLLTALELQRLYVARAEAWLGSLDAAPMEAHAVVGLWRRVLRGLEHDTSALVGRLDWVTKQTLLDQVGRDLSWEARKKVDLRYHDLGDGYHAWLSEAGLVDRMLDESDVERAMAEPPSDTPAAVRGALVRELPPGVPVRMDWRSARVQGRVIRFDRRSEPREVAREAARDDPGDADPPLV